METGRLLIVLTVAAMAVILATTGAGQHSQNGEATVEQSATVDGASVEIEQSSTVRTATDDGHSTRRTTQRVTKEPGEPAVVDRNGSRTGRLPDDRVQTDVQRDVTETEHGLTTSQNVRQQLTDQSDRATGTAATRTAPVTGTGTVASRGLSNDRQINRPTNANTSAASMAEDAAVNTAEQDADAATVRYSVTTFLDDIVSRITAAVTDIFE